jgi:(hydroxyamino)benzene mutase
MIQHRLIQAGALLFLLGLLTGFAVPATAAPRLALSGHLEGVMNGMVLILAGLIWPRLQLSQKSQRLTSGLLLYGTYVNWFTLLLASLWAAGAEMMPIAGGTATGTPVQEALVKFGLISLSVAMVAAFALILWGLRKPPTPAGA